MLSQSHINAGMHNFVYTLNSYTVSSTQYIQGNSANFSLNSAKEIIFIYITIYKTGQLTKYRLKLYSARLCCHRGKQRLD